MTPDEAAETVYWNATGPINITRYACDSLRECVADAIRVAVAAERGAILKELQDFRRASDPDLDHERGLRDAEYIIKNRSAGGSSTPGGGAGGH